MREFVRFTGTSGCTSYWEKSPGVLVPVFVCGAVVGAVKPSVRQCVEGKGEDECGECDALCGETDDEEGGEGVHGDVSLFLVCYSLHVPDQPLCPSG